ncbi:hypothetical protein A1O3_03599 [Capronia epimyces CBS 606.96]|uniref:Uncharacterized protein n=1 Tax=Capronia epimyces CBS 606.96 TaxID=1182542 RepID=W9YBK5_9EURO|nr:uncharacterized protein A1O3_03599 [Capronia epimyces CBS 606.96]EXJ86646.1 hypothetical protein A1O3_03599 [Capronia epimyces CBS 606.96]
MAPAISVRSASGEHFTPVIYRSVSSTLQTLSSRSTSSKKTPLASLFALIIRGTINLSKRTLTDGVLTSRSPVSEVIHPILIAPSSLSKRQNAILAIPTTYAGLNNGPAPGAIVGIILGSIAGFVLILYIILSAYRLSGYGNRETVVEEEVIHHRRRSPRRSRSRSQAMTEVSSPHRERVVEERVVVEEHLSPSVEEEDIVEVIEEHSPERPARKHSGRSGYRTVDPAEFGGGSRPMRKVSRR